MRTPGQARLWRVLAATLGASAGLAGASARAVAFWSSSDGSQPAVAVADALPAGPTPSVAVVGDGDTVDVSFAEEQTSVAEEPITAYDLERLPAGGGDAVAVTADCAVSAGTITCTEAAVPPGSWQYEVAPAVGSAWIGAYGPPGAVVTLPAP